LADPLSAVVKVARLRERGIFGQIKAEYRRNIRDLARFSNADLAEKARSEHGASFATGCKMRGALVSDLRACERINADPVENPQ
jgi:hypothetical protein